MAWSAPRTLSHLCRGRWSLCLAHPHAAAKDVLNWACVCVPRARSSESRFTLSKLDLPALLFSSQEDHPSYGTPALGALCVCAEERGSNPGSGEALTPCTMLFSLLLFPPGFFFLRLCFPSSSCQAPPSTSRSHYGIKGVHPHLQPLGHWVSGSAPGLGGRMPRPALQARGLSTSLFSMRSDAADGFGPRSLRVRLPGDPAEAAGRTGRYPCWSVARGAQATTTNSHGPSGSWLEAGSMSLDHRQVPGCGESSLQPPATPQHGLHARVPSRSLLLCLPTPGTASSSSSSHSPGRTHPSGGAVQNRAQGQPPRPPPCKTLYLLTLKMRSPLSHSDFIICPKHFESV